MIDSLFVFAFLDFSIVVVVDGRWHMTVMTEVLLPGAE
jgi:hypothetical protein